MLFNNLSFSNYEILTLAVLVCVYSSLVRSLLVSHSHPFLMVLLLLKLFQPLDGYKSFSSLDQLTIMVSSCSVMEELRIRVLKSLTSFKLKNSIMVVLPWLQLLNYFVMMLNNLLVACILVITSSQDYHSSIHRKYIRTYYLINLLFAFGNKLIGYDIYFG